MDVQGTNWTVFHDTLDINQQTAFFISVDGVEGKCPTTNGISNATINFGDEEDTELDNLTVYRFFDSGGEDGNYPTGELKTHTFYTTDGSRVLLHFNSINLSSVSQLYVFTGPYTRADSLLYSFGMEDNFPDYILSKSNTMTIGFRADKQSAPGWDAIIQHAPGVAVADVYPQSIATFRASVCRIDSAEKCRFVYPYQDIMSNIRDINGDDNNDYMDTLVWKAMGQPGRHVFEGYPIVTGGTHLLDVHGCDSIVRFELTVRKASMVDTTAVITSIDSLVWRGKVYRETGVYQQVITDDECGCDTAVVLHLLVLETDIDPMDPAICCDDSVTLNIGDIKAPDMMSGTPRPAIGDVLCSTLYDGGTMMVLPPDTFIHRVNAGEELYPIGVVFDIEVDVDGVSGKVIALKDASDTVCQYAIGTSSTSSDWNKITTQFTGSGVSYVGKEPKKALLDLDGEKNTAALKTSCYSNFSSDGEYNSFMQHAPAAAMCYYYDHKSCYIGSTLPTSGTRNLGWYLPAAGELYRYFIRRDIVNSTLKLLKENGYGAKLPYENVGDLQGVQLSQVGVGTSIGTNDLHEIDCKYHTSTERDKDVAWRVDYKGYLNQKHQKNMKEQRLSIGNSLVYPGLQNITIQYDKNISTSWSYYFHYARAVKKFTIYNE